MMNSVEYMESFLVIVKIGAIVVFLNWWLVVDELVFIFKDSGVILFIFG